MANPGDDLAAVVHAFIQSGARDTWGLATAYSLYMKQCGVEVDMWKLMGEMVIAQDDIRELGNA